jgi:hypothetical protein
VRPRSGSHWQVALVRCRPHKSVTVARLSARMGRISEPNSSSNKRSGSIPKPHPMDVTTDGLGAGGVPRLYFDEYLAQLKLHTTILQLLVLSLRDPSQNLQQQACLTSSCTYYVLPFMWCKFSCSCIATKDSMILSTRIIASQSCPLNDIQQTCWTCCLGGVDPCCHVWDTARPSYVP